MTKRIRLASLTQIRLELGRVYSDARSGTLPTQDATRLAYVLQATAKTLADEDLEVRIKHLEDRLP